MMYNHGGPENIIKLDLENKKKESVIMIYCRESNPIYTQVGDHASKLEMWTPKTEKSSKVHFSSSSSKDDASNQKAEVQLQAGFSKDSKIHSAIRDPFMYKSTGKERVWILANCTESVQRGVNSNEPMFVITEMIPIDLPANQVHCVDLNCERPKKHEEEIVQDMMKTIG